MVLLEARIEDTTQLSLLQVLDLFMDLFSFWAIIIADPGARN